ncbi:hypothetical protein [Rhodococcus jostii]|uniref:hypothetical protein n=1 Tax=Rhodococcus jostii TaxID=132919 RepID=UPI00363371B7
MKFIDGFTEYETRYEGVPGQKRLVIIARYLGPFGVSTDVRHLHFSQERALEHAAEIHHEMGERP